MFWLRSGILSYTLLNGIPWALRKISGGRIVPSGYETRDDWAIPEGGLIPPWMCVSLPSWLLRFES